MENENKQGKGLVAFLIILVLLLIGALGFGGYKYMSLQSDNDKLTSENKTIIEELNKQKQETEKAKSEQEKASTTNDYNLFVKQYKESVKSLNTNPGANYSSHNGEISYYIELTRDGKLSVIYNKKKYSIAEHVLFFENVMMGNGGLNYICYATEDGNAYVANHEEALFNKEKITSKKQSKANNVISIIPISGTYGPEAAFIDINGNMYNVER